MNALRHLDPGRLHPGRLRPRRLSARIALAFALALAAASLVGWFTVSALYFGAQHRDLDARLGAEMAGLPLVAWAAGERPDAATLDSLTARQLTLRVADADGRLRASTLNVVGGPALPLDWRALDYGGGAAHVSRAWGRLTLRSRVVPLRLAIDGPAAPPRGWAELSAFEFASYTDAARYSFMQLGVVVAVAVVMALLGVLIARVALRPLVAFARTAARVDDRSLGVRLASTDGDCGELGVLAAAFNGVLDRLGASIERERRFSADAAHELRTPLARVRAEVELARDALGDENLEPAGPRAALTRVLGDVDGMAATVHRLLTLARLDGDAGVDLQVVDLSRLARASVARAAAEADRRGIDLSADVEPGVHVQGEPSGLAEVLDNLVGNALQYTPEGGHVAVWLRAPGEEAVLEVCDDGTGFTEAEAGRLFERFYRSAAPNVQAHGGSGLGLAIVRRVAERHGGTVDGSSAGAGAGSRFVVRLPLARP